jgi:hypothetical protein
MSPNEHKLMVYMFVRETMLLKAFVEILRSRNILQDGDVEAFEELVRSQEFSNREIFASVAEQYRAFARELGLEQNLPHA